MQRKSDSFSPASPQLRSFAIFDRKAVPLHAGMRQTLIYTSKVVARLAPVALVCHTVSDRANCATFSAATYPANDPIEDRHLYRSAGDWSVAAVFDGHGGWQVSDFASQSLVDKVLQSIGDVSEKDEIRIDERIQQSFEAMEHEIIGKVRPAFNLGFGEVAKVGSCVLLALRRADRLVVANCGDCRAILGTAVPSTPSSTGTTERYTSTRITRDHNARVALEQLRLEQDHVGEEGLYRCKNPHACYVKGRLQLTRSLGDEYLKSVEFNGSKDKHRSG
jgi:pyruvate dehydrogenase phosphatase